MIYNLDPIETFISKATAGIKVNFIQQNNKYLTNSLLDVKLVSVLSSSSSAMSINNSKTVTCPVCTELVAGTRFAPHLEKCMNGGKRNSRKYYDALTDDTGLRPTKVSKVVEADPHPNSLIVRVRMKNGGTRALKY